MVKSDDYWETRERDWIAKSIHKDADMDALLAKKYDELELNLYKDIQSFYVNYAKSQNITMAEAKKRVAKFDVDSFSKEAAQLVKDKDFSPEANERLKLYNATMRINRQRALAAKVGLETAKVSNDAQGILKDKLEKDIYDESKHQVGILGKTIPERIDLRAKALIDASYQGAKWSDRLWVNNDKLVSDVGDIINRSLIEGMNPSQLASKLRPHLKDSVSNAKYAAQRLARTESTRVSNQYKQLLYKDQGYTKGKWIAEPSACKICLPKDGRIYDIDDIDIPVHANCRCSFVPNMSENVSTVSNDESDDNDLDVSGMFSKENERVLNSVNPNVSKEFYDYLNKAPNDLKQLFYKNRDNVEFVRDLKENGAYYRYGKVTIGNLSQAEGSPAQVVLHEMAHAIEGYSGAQSVPIKKHVYKRVLKRSTQEITYSDITTAAMEDKYKLAETLDKEAEKIAEPLFKKYDIDSGYGLPSVGWEPWRNEHIKSPADWNKYGEFSDIMQAGTNERVNLGSGHDSGYWTSIYAGRNEKGKRVKFRTGNGSQEQEFFAEMTENIIANPESYKLLKESFPESIKIYNQIVKDLLNDKV